MQDKGRFQQLYVSLGLGFTGSVAFPGFRGDCDVSGFGRDDFLLGRGTRERDKGGSTTYINAGNDR